MHTATLDSLNINDGTIYKIKRIPIFRTARKRIDIQPYLNDHGGEIVENTNFRDVVTHTVPVYVYGTSVDDLYANVQALQEKCEKTNVTFEYKHDDASNSTYATVLYMESLDPFEANDWDYLVESKQCLVEIEMTCMPDWYGAQQTIGPLYYSKTPAIIQPSTVLGDLETPCVLELSSSGSKAIGNKLYIGTRSKERAMSETVFNTIKDFQGSTGTGFYNGQFSRTSVVNSWTSLTGTSTNINSVAMESATVGVAVGDGGAIWTTADGWSTVADVAHGLTTQSLKKVVWAGGTGAGAVYYACGDAGVILKCVGSPASAGNWSALTSGVSQDLVSISAISTTVVWAITSTLGKVIKTTDGSTWTVKLAIGNPGEDVFAYDASTVVAVANAGTAGHISVTQNGGTDWTTYVNSTNKTLKTIAVVSATTAFIGTTDGKLYKTTSLDADPWSSITLQSEASAIYDIKMQSATVGWFAGANGVIRKTTNGGTSWTAQTSGTSANLNSISVVDASNVNIAGDGYTILDTSDGGTTWTQPIAAWALTMDYQDTYRGLFRLRTNSTNPDGVQVRASVGWAGGSVVASSAVSLANTTKQQVVELGNLTIPVVPLSSGLSAAPLVKLEAINGSTKSVNIDADWATLIPLSGQKNYCSTTATASQHITYDYAAEAVNKGYTNVDWVGDPGIKLNPGLNNNIVIAESKTYSTGTDGYNPVNVTMRYFPRYRSPVVGSTT